MTKVRLGYGGEDIEISIERGVLRGVCVPVHAAGVPDPENAIRASLLSPIDAAPLREFARGGRNAAILISGRDRVTRSDIFVKILADELNAAGITDETISVFLATGTHQKQTPEDIRSLLGPEAGARLRVVQHDPRDEANLIRLGRTSRGTPIAINRAVYETDIKILTGRIAHHYFAGFSGGRKAIAPGVAGLDTIVANHKLVMRADGNGRDTRVEAGRLAGNPVHEDMIEIAAAAGPAFCLNTVLNPDHEITHVVSGHPPAAHEAGCRIVESLFRLDPGERADVVLASCGGWPYDISFMQVLKTVVAASPTVADGGVLVVFGECERGLEPGFLDWFQYASLGELNRAVLANYNLKGHNTYWIREIQSRIRIVLVSRLAAADVAAMGFIPASGPAAALDIALNAVGENATILAVPYANITVFAEARNPSPEHPVIGRESVVS